MKDHLPNYQEDRARVQQERALNIERSNGHKPRRSWLRLAIAGVVLGLLSYLLVGWFVELHLQESKFDRHTVKVDHR